VRVTKRALARWGASSKAKAKQRKAQGNPQESSPSCCRHAGPEPSSVGASAANRARSATRL